MNLVADTAEANRVRPQGNVGQEVAAVIEAHDPAGDVGPGVRCAQHLHRHERNRRALLGVAHDPGDIGRLRQARRQNEQKKRDVPAF